MVKKKITITILMLCLVFSSLHAIENEPSVFELSVVNGYKLDHLVDADFNAYTPSLRVQFNIVERFGMGMGVMYQYRRVRLQTRFRLRYHLMVHPGYRREAAGFRPGRSFFKSRRT